jgi:hypothetical protein
MITMLVLSKYQDVLDYLIWSWREFAQDDIEHRVLVVRDGDVTGPESWKFIDGPKPFHYTKSFNLGIRECEPDDVFLVLDDMQFLQRDTIRRLNQIMQDRKDLGALSVVVPYGGLGLGYQWIGASEQVSDCQFMDYPAVYFRREALVPMDEHYFGYGWEDIDHCLMMKEKGWGLAVANGVHMNHGIGGSGMNATFKRAGTPAGGSLMENGKRFEEKWRGRLGFLSDVSPDSPIHNVIKELKG